MISSSLWPKICKKRLSQANQLKPPKRQSQSKRKKRRRHLRSKKRKKRNPPIRRKKLRRTLRRKKKRKKRRSQKLRRRRSRKKFLWMLLPLRPTPQSLLMLLRIVRHRPQYSITRLCKKKSQRILRCSMATQWPPWFKMRSLTSRMLLSKPLRITNEWMGALKVAFSLGYDPCAMPQMKLNKCKVDWKELVWHSYSDDIIDHRVIKCMWNCFHIYSI